MDSKKTGLKMEEVISNFFDSKFSFPLSFKNPKAKDSKAEVSDIILWLNRKLFLIEIKTKEDSKSTIELWIKRRLEKAIDQIVTNYNRIMKHEKIVLHNDYFNTFLDTIEIKQIIGLIILVYDENCDLLPSNLVPHIYKQELQIHALSWNDLKNMTDEIDTIPDLIYYLNDRNIYLNKTGSDLPLGKELNLLGLYKLNNNNIPERNDLYKADYWIQYTNTKKDSISKRSNHNKYSIMIDKLLEGILGTTNLRRLNGNYLPIGLYYIWELSQLSRRERSLWGEHALNALEKFYYDKNRIEKHFAMQSESTQNWFVFYFSKEDPNTTEKKLEELIKLKLIVAIEEDFFEFACFGVGYCISPTQKSFQEIFYIVRGVDSIKNNYTKSDIELARKKFQSSKNIKSIKIEEFPN